MNCGYFCLRFWFFVLYLTYKEHIYERIFALFDYISDFFELINKKKKKNPYTTKLFLEWTLRFLWVLLVLSVFHTTMINAEIPSASMEGTICVGDRIFCNKLAYCGDKHPERYDIVIFRDVMGSGKYLIKRVIGLPGDTLTFRGGYVYLNDNETPLDDSFCKLSGVTDQGLLETNVISVPEDCYFVMGDNRLDSLDSRFWMSDYGENTPFVREDEILAKAVFRYFPFDSIGMVE